MSQAILIQRMLSSLENIQNVVSPKYVLSSFSLKTLQWSSWTLIWFSHCLYIICLSFLIYPFLCMHLFNNMSSSLVAPPELKLVFMHIWRKYCYVHTKSQLRVPMVIHNGIFWIYLLFNKYQYLPRYQYFRILPQGEEAFVFLRWIAFPSFTQSVDSQFLLIFFL